MSDAIEAVRLARQTIKDAKAAALSQSKEAFAKAAASFFTKYPEIEAIRWRQYTPYFNDGDTCEFGVSDLYLRLVGTTKDDGNGDYGDGYLGTYELMGGYSKKKPPKFPTAEACVRELEELMNLFGEELLESMFGDHVRVTCHRDANVTIDPYDHD